MPNVLIKDITTDKCRFLSVKVPESARSFILIGCKLHFYDPNGKGSGKSKIKLPPGEYKILGKKNDLTEELCSTLVPTNFEAFSKSDTGPIVEKYYTTAVQSLNALIQYNVMQENTHNTLILLSI